MLKLFSSRLECEIALHYHSRLVPRGRFAKRRICHPSWWFVFQHDWTTTSRRIWHNRFISVPRSLRFTESCPACEPTKKHTIKSVKIQCQGGRRSGGVSRERVSQSEREKGTVSGYIMLTVQSLASGQIERSVIQHKRDVCVQCLDMLWPI